MPYGKYYILSGTHKDFIDKEEAVAYTSFWVTGISFSSIRNGHDETELFVVDSETGKALPNVIVQQYTYDYGRNKRSLKISTRQRIIIVMIVNTTTIALTPRTLIIIP